MSADVVSSLRALLGEPSPDNFARIAGLFAVHQTNPERQMWSSYALEHLSQWPDAARCFPQSYQRAGGRSLTSDKSDGSFVLSLYDGYRNPWLQRITGLVQELYAHPKIKVLAFHLYPPVKEKSIKLGQERWGEIEEEILSFYRATNGFHLAWTHVDAPDFAPSRHYFHTGHWNLDPVKGEKPPPGMVTFPSFEDVFFVQSSRYDRALAERFDAAIVHASWRAAHPHFRVFEYADSSVCVGLSCWGEQGRERSLLHEQGMAGPSVMVGAEGWWDRANGLLCTFGTYLSLLLHTKGHHHRYQVLKVSGLGLLSLGCVAPLSLPLDVWETCPPVELSHGADEPLRDVAAWLYEQAKASGFVELAGGHWVVG